jgi:hypothetical protein
MIRLSVTMPMETSRVHELKLVASLFSTLCHLKVKTVTQFAVLSEI